MIAQRLESLGIVTALSILATLHAELGDLDRIDRIIKVSGMVNVAPGFDQTPAEPLRSGG